MKKLIAVTLILLFSITTVGCSGKSLFAPGQAKKVVK